MRLAHLKTISLLIFKLAAAAGLIWWIVRRGGLEWSQLRLFFEPRAFLVLFGLVAAQVWVANLRWQSLLFAQGFSPPEYRRGKAVWQTLKAHWSYQTTTGPLTLIGLFFNYAVPGSVGGDFVKAYYLTQLNPERKLDASLTVLVDRLVGFFVMLVSGAVAYLWTSKALLQDVRVQTIGNVTITVAIGFGSFFALAFSRRVRRWVVALGFKSLLERLPGSKQMLSIYESLHTYRKNGGAIFSAALLSALNQVLLVMFFAYVGFVQGETVASLNLYWFCIPIGLVVMSLPLAPAGVGVGQAAFFFLFEIYLGRPTTLGSNGITVLQMMQFILSLIGAFFYLKRGWQRTRIPVGTS